MWKIILSLWGPVAIIIGIALYYTHDIRCLWFLLIPACIGIHEHAPDNDEEENE